MSGSIKGPTKGSGAYLALQHLQKLAGLATADNLMVQLTWSDTPARFQRLIVGPLERMRLVMRRGDQVSLTARGATFLDPTALPPAPAACSYVAPQRVLSPRNRPSVRCIRPGAFDYRDIPSLHAGKQVAFRSSITMPQEDNNG